LACLNTLVAPISSGWRGRIGTAFGGIMRYLTGVK